MRCSTYYMVKPFDPAELVARVRMLLRRSGTNLDANPLTRIPGNVSIQKELEDLKAGLDDVYSAVAKCHAKYGEKQIILTMIKELLKGKGK